MTLNITISTGKLCEEDLKAIAEWTFNLNVDDDSLLTESGGQELRLIGQRSKARLPEIFDQPYNEQEITVNPFFLHFKKIYES